ncbi:MAG: hypothetical protein WD688_20000 [Candidatus Binatia bacterium]
MTALAHETNSDEKFCRTMGKCRNTGDAMLSRNGGDLVWELIVNEQP